METSGQQRLNRQRQDRRVAAFDRPDACPTGRAVVFGGTGVLPVGVGDPFADLVCHFQDEPEAWAPGEGEGTLVGALVDGSAIRGTDSICVVP